MFSDNKYRKSCTLKSDFVLGVGGGPMSSKSFVLSPLPVPCVWRGCGKDVIRFYYHRIKKGEDQGKYVTFSTMMHNETGESLEIVRYLRN